MYENLQPLVLRATAAVGPEVCSKAGPEAGPGAVGVKPGLLRALPSLSGASAIFSLFGSLGPEGGLKVVPEACPEVGLKVVPEIGTDADPKAGLGAGGM